MGEQDSSLGLSALSSTVAPLDWGAFVQPEAKGSATGAADGTETPMRPPTPDQPSLFGGGAGSRPVSQAAASADATMERRWRALAATAPIHQLARNISHQDVNDEAYDLRQLALGAIDLVVASMGYGQELTVEAATDHLITLARAMNPSPAREGEHQEVAAAVLANLLNHTADQRRFSYRYADIAADPRTWREYSFKLLQLRETEHGDCLVASDQAVMLYVAALDTDLEDAEYAHAVMLRRQLADGRLASAEFSAAQARRTSEGYAANLATLLTDTIRDVSSHDWALDVPARLSRARKHINDRLGDDDRLLEHLRAGLDADVTAEVRATSGRIIDLLGSGRDMHLLVLSTLVDARTVHVQSLTRQRLAPRARLRLLRLSQDLLSPTHALAAAAAEAVTTAFADAASGISVPRQATLGLVLRGLWAQPRLLESAPPIVEEPEFADEVDPQAYPEHIIDAARTHLEPVRTGAVRLSALLEAIHGTDLDEDTREAISELVVLSALWAFDPVIDDDDENAAQVDLLAADLHAVDDGTALEHRWAAGADLLISYHNPDRPAEAADTTDGPAERSEPEANPPARTRSHLNVVGDRA